MEKIDSKQLPKVDKATRQWFYHNHIIGKTATSYRQFYWRFWYLIYKQIDLKFIKEVYQKQDELREKLEDDTMNYLKGLIAVKDKSKKTTTPKSVGIKEVGYIIQDSPEQKQAEDSNDTQIYRQDVPWRPNSFGGIR